MKESTQMIFVEKSQLINEVITLQEAAELLGCADSTLRSHVLKGYYKEGEFRKTKGVILFNKRLCFKSMLKMIQYNLGRNC